MNMVRNVYLTCKTYVALLRLFGNDIIQFTVILELLKTETGIGFTSV